MSNSVDFWDVYLRDHQTDEKYIICQASGEHNANELQNMFNSQLNNPAMLDSFIIMIKEITEMDVSVAIAEFSVDVEHNEYVVDVNIRKAEY